MGAPPNLPQPTNSSTAVPPSPAGSTISTTSRRSPTRKTARQIAAEAAQALHDEQHNSETNINVVVRCRGRSEREIRESSVVVVSTPGGLRGREIALSMGPLALSNKTYSFDRVFGPEADQTMIYDDVVAPMLDEMLMGFNCTIFAYGQTGTGKTYTMTGDMADNFGSYSDTAGIIPRALYQLFAKLGGADEKDNSVKCSFIELYNEELRDLLAADDNAKVKIFEDSTRKGAIVIQGMEESFIKSAEDGVRLLQDGSHKRQVAATKCNDLSSRSHTVFTITVHVKVMGEDGEDMLRTGKLNLVDLAGSENIGRSGAENKRAREAGMINQSLLTLGRVINALVDKSPHIPYRESKLTRLLQDSLGGRTKTCIIATISPAKCNLEETMSTLDYAARAKDIRNKPQMNQMLTKKALIREYVLEIEKLKGDLHATRQKNGVFLTSESYQEMTEESESRRILNEEQQRKIEVMENSLKNTREQFESNMRMFVALKKDHESTNRVLEETKGSLEKTELHLESTQRDLADETVLRIAHENTEQKLDRVGRTLITTLGETVKDVAGLHGKIRRMADLEVTNHGTWQRSSGAVVATTELVESELGVFTGEQQRLAEYVTDRLAQFAEVGIAKLDDAYSHIENRLEGFNGGEAALAAEMHRAKEEMNAVLEEIKVLREEVKTRVGEGLKGLNDAAERIAAEVVEDLAKFGTMLHESYAQLGREFRVLFDEAQKSVVAQKAEVEKMRVQLVAATAASTSATRKAQEDMDAILKDEREKAAKEREALISQLSRLINGAAEQQDKRLTARIQRVQSDVAAVQEELEAATKEYKEGMDEWTGNEEKFIENLNGKKEGLKTRLQVDWQAAEAQNAAIQSTTAAIHAESVSLVGTQVHNISTQLASLDGFVTRARAANESHHTQLSSTLQTLVASVRDTCTAVGTKLAEVKEDTEIFADDFNAHTAALGKALDPVEAVILPALSDLRRSVVRAPMKEYCPTGATPRKREYEYPVVLPRTAPREVGEEEDEVSPLTTPTAAVFPGTGLVGGRTPLGEKEVCTPNKTVGKVSGIPGARKIFGNGRGMGGDAAGDEEADGYDEEDGPPPKRTRSQSAKLGVVKGGYSAGVGGMQVNRSASGGDVVGKKRSR
ncbi:kinesin-domain-containing protein [Morchella conica CCBAS932]|uniref:Kinesin-domain-containing protein n=1 Tax=Morchella conica CCBAS932 TaxID=1392247 RepID=A0A3N4L085_9PEZI|nr:kinesin-domain-containing protein [Morchella conica CCBAS932]